MVCDVCSNTFIRQGGVLMVCTHKHLGASLCLGHVLIIVLIIFDALQCMCLNLTMMLLTLTDK